MSIVHRLSLHKGLRHIPLIRSLLNWAPDSRLARAVNIHDLRECAEKRAHAMVYGYLDSGSDDEIAKRRATEAYDDIEMHFNVLRGLKPPIDMSTRVFGRDVRLPFFGSPTAGQRMFHSDGEMCTARVAKQEGMLFGLSSLATTSIQDIATVNPDGPKVFQLYVWKDRGLLKSVIDQAKEAKYDALALTVDFTFYGNRERDIRNGFTIPPSYSPRQILDAAKRPAWTWDLLTNDPYTYALLDKAVPAESLAKFVNEQISPEFGWKDAEWLLGEWGGKTAIKGVTRADDAVKAKALGFHTVWVSNHGARQLETSPPTIDVLPHIRDSLGDDMEIIVDGGVMRGTHICKALAMGADAVAVGKAYLYGLAAGGESGVEKAITILKTELERAMGLLGVGSICELKSRGPTLLRRRGSTMENPARPRPQG